MSDLVSIVMPSYNTAQFIGETIKSVLGQTYDNWELIIVDDCSTDNTEEIVNSFNDKRINFIKNEKNSGAAISRNKALKVAKGRWVAFLDSDDVWNSKKLEKQIKFMEDNNYGFSYTNYHKIDEKSNNLAVIVTGPKVVTKSKMLRYNWMGCLTVMYDREKVGLIQINNIRKRNDYALWLKAIKKVNCYLLDEDLAGYRIRTGSISRGSKIKLLKWHYDLFRMDYNSVFASVLTLQNMVFGVYKKIAYVKKVGC